MWSEIQQYRWLFTVGICLGLSGCNEPSTQTDPDIQQAAPARQSEITPETVKRSAVSDDTAIQSQPKALAKLTINDISGGWRVVLSSREDNSTLGAIAEIYPEAVSWSFKPRKSKKLEQLCREPVLGELAARRSPEMILSASEKLSNGTELKARTALYELKCAAGGAWGPPEGADLMMLDDGKLLMTWRDKEQLVLEKLPRPNPKQDMKPSDYKSDDTR